MPNKKKHPGRTIVVFLVLILAMGTALAVGAWKGKTSVTPNLALDLEGGTQLILTPKADPKRKGAKQEVNAEDIAQAIEVIRQRVDASGVSEAEITSQGTENIVVSLPGNPSQETLDLVRKSAELNFRAVLLTDYGMSKLQMDQAVAEQAKAQQEAAKKDKKAGEAANAGAAEIQAPTETDPLAYAKTQAKAYVEAHPLTGKPSNNSDLNFLTEEVMTEFYAKDCTDKKNLEGGNSGDPDKPLVSCSLDGTEKYVLSPVELPGTHIASAEGTMGVGPNGQSTGQWVVNLKFDSKGADIFTEVSKRLYGFRQGSGASNALATQQNDPRNRFAIVLDGNVVSAPGINSPITGGSAEISGSFTKSSATTLANQLKFGSLPLNFEVKSEQKVSATLGSDQLRYGIWAGIIGLILVVIYLIWQYRGLAIIAIGSLVSAGVILYLVLALLSWSMGYRLSLAGVAGVIISIGTTADSFIVYFERIRDEVRDGRPLAEAVEEGWRRAKRTIVTSDAVNVLAAVVLYLLAVGGVQGFAFTLGVTTVIDLAVIFMFTHPMMVLLLKFKFFGEGHRLSGLDPEHLGAQVNTYRYMGAGQVRKVRSVYKTKPAEESSEDNASGQSSTETKLADSAKENSKESSSEVTDKETAVESENIEQEEAQK